MMVESILLNQSRLLPVTVALMGEYGLENVAIGVPCRLGCGGIASVLELDLSDEEMAALRVSAESVRQNIAWAQEILMVSN
ncbi:malate dehydrogenase, partial [Fischerella thermalis WC217]